MGYWEEKKKYEDAKVSRPQTLRGALVNCTYCGKYFCLKHIDEHKCKK